MKTNTEIQEEQAEIARARLKQRFDSFSNRYSLTAFKEASRQLGNKQEINSISSAIESITKNPASSALLALAAGQLFGTQKNPTRQTDVDRPASLTQAEPESLSPVDPAARKSAVAWARQHPVLSGATALAIGIGAGYVLINGRRRVGSQDHSKN